LKLRSLRFVWTAPAKAFGQVIRGKRGFNLQGWIEWRSQTCIYGWVWDACNPSERIRVVARIAHKEIASAVADDYRSDLESAGIGDGRHAFMLEFGRCDPELVSVEIAGTGFPIPVLPRAVADATAVQQGSDGWLFLRLGTNQVVRFFTEENYFTAAEIERWCMILAERERGARELGAIYFHFIVPDKITVYCDRYAGPLQCYDNRPSRVIPLALHRAGLSHVYIDITPSLIAERDSALLYYKTDTHWTPFGALIAYKQICKAIDVKECDLSAITYVEHAGAMDLGNKLDTPVHETCFYAQVPNPAAQVFANELATFFDKKPMYHSLRGRYTVYRNDGLAGAKKLVIFGDSFCTTGSFLTFLTQTFHEVHFVWSTSMDLRYVEDVRPDIVITEIAERFVKSLPDDRIDLREFAALRFSAMIDSASFSPSFDPDDSG
jgi:alginate O-acetyltransferase complex protein AlgJ